MNIYFIDQPKDGSYDDGKLIIVTDSQVIAIQLHRCHNDKITSCRWVFKTVFYHTVFLKYIMLIKHKFSLLNTYVVDGKADEQKK